MIKAFISHSSAQKTFADEIARILGFDNCFIDNSTFENGMKTIDEIYKAIGCSAIFVFLISKEALASDWVKEELSNVRDYVDDGKITFLPFIIDERINHDEASIKPWIRKDYNLQTYSNPILVARKIKEEIREISWKMYRDLRKKDSLFQGRDEELALLKRKYYDGNMSARRCLIISGFPPEIGRRKLITEYVKRELSPTKSSAYEPILIDLNENSSIEDLIFQLNDIVLCYSRDEILVISSQKKDEKVKVAVRLFCLIEQMKEVVIIRDNGVCVLSDGRLSYWFSDILHNPDLPHRMCLFVAASYFVSQRTENIESSLISLRINPLKKDAIKVLFFAYADIKNISIPSGADSLIEKIPGLPSYIFRSADLMGMYGNTHKVVAEIDRMLKDEEKGYVPIINKLKEDEDVFQVLVLMHNFEFISHDIIEQVLARIGKSDNIYKYLEKLYSFGLFETIGGNNQYLRLNSVVSDYIRRNKIGLNVDFRNSLQQVLKEYVVSDDSAYEDLSGYLMGIQTAIKEDIKHIDKKYLIPSFTLKVIIDEYGNKQYEKVVALSERFLEDSINYYDEIVRSIRYWLCMALCRLRSDKFYNVIDKFNGYSKSFLLGFYHRCKGEYNPALGYYQAALDQSKANKDANYVAKAKHEIVVVKLKLDDYEGALSQAKDNYSKQKTNRYHVEAYFKCIARSANLDSVLLAQLLGEYKQLVVDSKTETIYQTMSLEYRYYALHDKSVLVELRRLVASSEKNIRFYPYKALRDIAARMNALRTIDDLPNIYKDDLNDRDLELEQ